MSVTLPSLNSIGELPSLEIYEDVEPELNDDDNDDNDDNDQSDDDNSLSFTTYHAADDSKSAISYPTLDSDVGAFQKERVDLVSVSLVGEEFPFNEPTNSTLQNKSSSSFAPLFGNRDSGTNVEAPSENQTSGKWFLFSEVFWPVS